MKTGITSAPDYDTIVTLSQMKAHLLIEHSQDDTFLQKLIYSAISTCEKTGRISIPITERYVEYSRNKVGARYYLPYGKVQSVQRVALVHADGVTADEELMVGDDYYFRAGDSVIFMVNNDELGDDTAWTLRIEYTAGFTADELATVNSNLYTAITQFVTHLYEHRGEDKRTAVNVPKETRNILGEYWTSPTYHT